MSARSLYVGSHAADSFESRRIGLLSELYDPLTIRRIARLGIQPGWRCLEVGAGSGSIARWLVQHTGSDGRVVATDVNVRFLSEEEGFEVRRHDIVEEALEEEFFDLVHCRTVLMHVSEPVRALERMFGALRPGGWLVVEETDFTSFGAADPGHPAAPDFDRITQTIIKALHKTGLVDTYFGRRLRCMVDDLGLVAGGHEGTTRTTRHSEVGARYHRMNFCELVKPVMIEDGVLTEADFSRLESIFDDPGFSFVDRTLFACWGRRPD